MDYLIIAMFVVSGLSALGGYWLSEIDKQHKLDEGRRITERALKAPAEAEPDAGVGRGEP